MPRCGQDVRGERLERGEVALADLGHGAARRPSRWAANLWHHCQLRCGVDLPPPLGPEPQKKPARRTDPTSPGAAPSGRGISIGSSSGSCSSLIGPSNTQGGSMRSIHSTAMKVMVRQRPCGALPIETLASRSRRRELPGLCRAGSAAYLANRRYLRCRQSRQPYGCCRRPMY